MVLEDFIAGLPKAELHLHIEGTLEPEALFTLAGRNHVDIPFKGVEDVRAAYDFSNLQDFLDIYFQGMNVLRTEEDFFDLTMAYLKRAARENVRHAEIFFDPQGHTGRGIPYQTVIDGISSALSQGRELGITSGLILCFLRHLSEEDALATLRQAERFLDRIIGIGLDSSEIGNPPAKFTRVFARARDMGLKLCAHAGEEGPPAYIHEALDVLRIDRLDHGIRAMEDPGLISRLAKSGMVLTVCPLSNLRLKVFTEMAQSPVKRMLDAGLTVTINSDDPAYFGGTINDNYLAVAQALELSQADLRLLARNSFAGSFLPADEKARLIDLL